MARTATSTTTTLELDEIFPHSVHVAPSIRDEGDGAKKSRPTSVSSGPLTRTVEGSLPSPTTAADVVQRWNYPRSNTFKVLSCFWSMIVIGANDGSYGALIPYLETFYTLNYTVISLIFLSPFVGYVLSALLNNYLHLRVGQRGIALMCSSCHVVAYLAISLHPPYPVLVVMFMFAGFGHGVGDACWNAYIGNLANANELLGFLHAFYGVGGVLGPLIPTTMVEKYGLRWYQFFYVMIGIAVIEMITTTAAFWKVSGKAYREMIRSSGEDGRSDTGLKEALFMRPHARVTWLCATFLLAYVGTEVTLGGWIVTFMRQVRQGEAFASGMTATGFWLGLTVGRVVLGFVTPRVGVKLALSIYIPITMVLQLLFWLVPQFYVSAVAVSLQGFFLGPLFPGAVVAATRLLPRHLHVTTISFAAAFGGCGAAVIPFAVGAISQAKGVQTLQPIVLALLVVLLSLWLGLPRLGKKRE